MKHNFFAYSFLCILLINTNIATAMENDNQQLTQQVSLNSISIPKQKNHSSLVGEESISKSRTSSTESLHNSLSKKPSHEKLKNIINNSSSHSATNEQKENLIETFYTYSKPFYQSCQGGFYLVKDNGKINTSTALTTKHLQKYNKCYKSYITRDQEQHLSVRTTHFVPDLNKDETVSLKQENQSFINLSLTKKQFSELYKARDNKNIEIKMICIDNDNNSYLIYDEEDLTEQNNSDEKDLIEENSQENDHSSCEPTCLSYNRLLDNNNNQYRCFVEQYNHKYKIVVERIDDDCYNKIYSKRIDPEIFSNKQFERTLFYINDTQCIVFDENNNFTFKTVEPKNLISDTSKQNLTHMLVGAFGFTTICLAMLYKQYCIEQQIYLSGIA